MKYQQILSALIEEPMVLTPTTHASLVTLFERHQNRERIDREGVDDCGEKVELEQAQLIDGIMHIPVNGPIGRNLGQFEKGAGCVDVGDITEEIDKAEEDPMCRGIVFHFDSPGGMYSGTPECANRIAQCEKPTAAFIPGMACSGAYWLAVACDMVCATISADIGNVGVYCYLLDWSETYKQAGVKPELITSGQYKGMGSPGIPLTKVQREHLQERVNEMADQFYQHVQTNRPDVQLEDMQGQCWKAPAALDKGFLDMIVQDVDEVVEMLG